jgi:predicted phosphodiesterase
MTSRSTGTSVELFALEPTAAQLVVRTTAPVARVSVGGEERRVRTSKGIGAVVVDGLEPATSHSIRVDGEEAGELRTLAEPPGPYLGRFATVSDLHVGETGFGRAPRLHLSDEPEASHPVICLRAALAEIQAWGAEALYVKGDISHDSRAAEYDRAAKLLSTFDGVLHVIRGNHDGGNHRHEAPAPALARHGIELSVGTTATKAAGLDVVLVDTVHRGREHGFAPPSDDQVFELAARGGPMMIVQHHQLMTTRFPYYLPAGVYQPDAGRFLDRIAAENPAVLVTSGHTHRHRRRNHGPIVVTEVGSVKDYPGTWAGYLVYEGGVVQTVRRVMSPTALAWTERTRRNALGAWGRWSPGTLSDRSFSHTWPTR